MVKKKITIDTGYLANVYRNGMLEEWDINIEEALGCIQELVEDGEDLSAIELMVNMPLEADFKVDVSIKEEE